MSVGKSRRRQAVAVPRRLERAAAAEEVDHRDVGERHVGRRHADLHDGAREVARVERLLQHFGPADRLDAHVGAVAVGELLDPGDHVLLRRVDRVRRAELLGPLELLRVEVDGDDRARARRAARARDRGVADAAAAEHRDGVVAADAARVLRGAEAGHHAAAEQTRGLRLRRRRRPSSPDPRRRASSPRTRRCRARATARVPSSSVIFCVALCVAKQYHGRPRRHARHSPHTARQLRTTKSPGATPVTSGADRFDDARGLVAEQEREVVADAAFAVVQVGVADAARLHLHERFAGTGIGHDDRLDGDGLLGAGRHDTANVSEPCSLSHSTASSTRRRARAASASQRASVSAACGPTRSSAAATASRQLRIARFVESRGGQLGVDDPGLDERRQRPFEPEHVPLHRRRRTRAS